MKKKTTLILVAVLLIISLVVGLSYARWAMTNTQTTINKLTSSCFSMELTNEKDSINLNTTYPITDNEGKKLTPYQFTITNTCDLFASYTINLEMLEGTTLSSQYIKTMINSEAITNLSTLESVTPTIDGATESRVLFKGSLGAGDSTDYTFRLWMDYDAPLSSDTISKVFNSKITVTSEVSTYSPVENGFNKLAEALLVNEYQTTSVDVAKNKISSKQNVDTTKTAPIIIWQEYRDTILSQITAGKAKASDIGKYNITENDTKVMLGTSYNLDTTTGYYTIDNTAYYNLLEVDFSSDEYYYCNSSIGINGSRIQTSDSKECTTIYLIDSVENVTERILTLSDETKVTTDVYHLKGYKMTEIELESDKSDKGLYEAEDDDGTTYYYRGNVSNNYVKFANFYWRVVRINGDGSIRLLYAGRNINDNLYTTKTQYNNLSNDPTYVGYMYSNTLGVSYQNTISNEVNSNVKNILDNWYKTNILDKGYNSYVADSGFCSDRTFATHNPGNGYSAGITSYYAMDSRSNDNSPTFICANKDNDLFTLASNDKGNKKLTYPIGLVTADELLFSGNTGGYLNKMAYTFAGVRYWTMTPSKYYTGINTAYVWLYNEDGSVSAYHGYVTSANAVRPVINLKSTTEITGGIGTANDPFIIK